MHPKAPRRDSGVCETIAGTADLGRGGTVTTVKGREGSIVRGGEQRTACMIGRDITAMTMSVMKGMAVIGRMITTAAVGGRMRERKNIVHRGINQLIISMKRKDGG